MRIKQKKGVPAGSQSALSSMSICEFEPSEAVVFLVFHAKQVENQRGVTCGLNCAVVSLAGFFKLETPVRGPGEQAERLPAEVMPGLSPNNQTLVEMYLACCLRGRHSQHSGEPAILDDLNDVKQVHVREAARQYLFWTLRGGLTWSRVAELSGDRDPGIKPLGFQQPFICELEIACRDVEACQREAVLGSLVAAPGVNHRAFRIELSWIVRWHSRYPLSQLNIARNNSVFLGPVQEARHYSIAI